MVGAVTDVSGGGRRPSAALKSCSISTAEKAMHRSDLSEAGDVGAALDLTRSLVSGAVHNEAGIELRILRLANAVLVA